SRLRGNLDPRLPVHPAHVQFTGGRAEFMLDSFSWISRMQDFALTFGPRIHGNIASILARTPAVVLAHDSRTLELAEYHSIPHFRPDELAGITSVRDVVDRADFKNFNRRHAESFDRYVSYIERSGFSHIYARGEVEALDRYESSAEKAF